jgi:hypothetical protein
VDRGLYRLGSRRGKKYSEIAEELGIARRKVSEALNELAEEIREGLSS